MTPTAPQEARTGLISISVALARVVARVRAIMAARDAERWAMA